MFRHLVKLVWHRKRHGLLMVLEIFCSFLVVFIVGTIGIDLWSKYQRPLGYEYENVWSVNIDMKQTSDDYWSPEQVALFSRLLSEAKSVENVEAVAGSTGVPFDLSSRTGGWEVNGRFLDVSFEEVTDTLNDVLHLDLIQGRWFDRSDDAQNWRPVVVTRDLARDVFGDADPIGKRIDMISEHHDYRVVGVVRDFRIHGEVAPLENFMFYRKRVGDPSDRPPRNLLVRVRPGTPAESEERLIQRLQEVAPEWSFQVRTLEQMRGTAFRLRLTPLIAGGVVAFFLMLMVALGMSGVLWQNVVERTREIGLRRAMGASRAGIYRQILTELYLLAGLGVLLGTILVVQLPTVELLVRLSTGAFMTGLLFSIAAILLLATVCGLYPSWLASRVPPAEALRYE